MSAKDAPKIAYKRTIQTMTGGTGNWAGNKIAENITKATWESTCKDRRKSMVLTKVDE